MPGFAVPPHAATALLIGESALFFATQQHLANKGLAVPRDVSLIVLDDHPSYEWFDPEVSRIRTDTAALCAAGGAMGGIHGERQGRHAQNPHPRGIRRRRDDRPGEGVSRS